MSNLLILIPVALLMGLAGLGAFLWSLRSRQYDDMDGAAARILDNDYEDAPLADNGMSEPRRRARRPRKTG